MAENAQLAAFLAEESRDRAPPPEAPQQAPQSAPEPAADRAAPEPAAKPETPPKAPEDDDAAPPPSPLEGEDVVALRAFQDERKKRQDWKVRAVEAETKRADLERRLEEATRAATAPPPQPQYQPPPQIPNPATDPAGYHQWMVEDAAKREINGRLNMSEIMLRKELGREKVDALIAEFKQAAAVDQSLYQKLYQQQDPYGWAAEQVERIRMHREIGDDPAAYRARIEAEARAKWEQEARAAPPASNVPNLGPSLATARSVAGRTAQAWTGEPSLDDLVHSIQTRKQGQNRDRGRGA